MYIYYIYNVYIYIFIYIYYIYSYIYYIYAMYIYLHLYIIYIFIYIYIYIYILYINWCYSACFHWGQIRPPSLKFSFQFVFFQRLLWRILLYLYKSSPKWKWSSIIIEPHVATGVWVFSRSACLLALSGLDWRGLKCVRMVLHSIFISVILILETMENIGTKKRKEKSSASSPRGMRPRRRSTGWKSWVCLTRSRFPPSALYGLAGSLDLKTNNNNNNKETHTYTNKYTHKYTHTQTDTHLHKHT